MPSHPSSFPMASRPAALAIAVAAAVVVVVVVVAVVATLPSLTTPSKPPDNPPLPPRPQESPCKESMGPGYALCIETTVTGVIDGDTVDVEGGLRIRLVLVDAPEPSQAGGSEAKAYLESLCLGASAMVDEDDYQVGEDPYGRVLAVVYCAGANANAAMLFSGHADTYYRFCSASEFGPEAWTGCSSRPPPPDDCDPAYPDVCIPPPPPDLDCADIPYRSFQVLPPDPHRFDGDGDGIGCEG